jgi:peptidoglycan/xylan/chitin deacetylase (PgdA/CDA1 family)
MTTIFPFRSVGHPGPGCLDTNHESMIAPHIIEDDSTGTGKPRITVTSSWDDGHPSDLRLAELMNRFGIRGTSYIPLENEEHQVLDSEGIRALAREGLEIGGHTYHHVRIDSLSPERAMSEVITGKEALEELLGTEVTSFCYPRGKFNRMARSTVKKAGFAYARTTWALHTELPHDPLVAPVTMQVYPHPFKIILRHSIAERNRRGVRRCVGSRRWISNLVSLLDHFIEDIVEVGGHIHIWGHSWELDEMDLWPLAEQVFHLLSGIPGASFVTNSELVGDRACDSRKNGLKTTDLSPETV